MAWRLRVEARDRLNDGNRVAIQFFDDTDPTRVLAREVFMFPSGTVKADAIAQIRARGAVIRAQLADADALAQQISPGDEAPV